MDQRWSLGCIGGAGGQRRSFALRLGLAHVSVHRLAHGHTFDKRGAREREYIRDPSRTLQIPTLAGSWAWNPTLPADAGDTGYRYGALKLYLAPSDENSHAYLVAPADSERWPRSDPEMLCA